MTQKTSGLLDMLQGMVLAPGDSGNAPIMMMLGTFKFSLNTAVFQEYQRSSEYRHATIERFGKRDVLQFTGPGADTITLPGVVYPDFRGGIGQIDQLRQLALTGNPQWLITSTGIVAGYWSITNIHETQSHFKPDGTFRKQEFKVELKYFGEKLVLVDEVKILPPGQYFVPQS